LAETDPRFVKARELLDRGWETFRKHRAVAQLAERKPALVVIDDPVVNAFVIGDHKTGLSVFSVHVQTGALDAMAPDDANLGLMMHELQHGCGGSRS
jgi:Zn-dependent protease with chaperone function